MEVRREGSKDDRRVVRVLVATYHEAVLAGLVEHVAEAIERYRAGELDVHDVDEVIHRYQKAARELWKFCFRGGSGAYVEAVAAKLERLTAESERPDGGQGRNGGVVNESWLSIKVELLSGGGLVLEHHPGRIMIASPRHTLGEFADAIDLAFARWDHSHLHSFDFGDGSRYMLGGSE